MVLKAAASAAVLLSFSFSHFYFFALSSLLNLVHEAKFKWYAAVRFLRYDTRAVASPFHLFHFPLWLLPQFHSLLLHSFILHILISSMCCPLSAYYYSSYSLFSRNDGAEGANAVQFTISSLFIYFLFIPFVCARVHYALCKITTAMLVAFHVSFCCKCIVRLHHYV